MSGHLPLSLHRMLRLSHALQVFDIPADRCLLTSAKTGVHQICHCVYDTHTTYQILPGAAEPSAPFPSWLQGPPCQCLWPERILERRLCHASGKGLDAILPAIIEYIPPPKGRPDGLLKLLLFDAYHDEYRGVICRVSAHMHSTHDYCSQIILVMCTHNVLPRSPGLGLLCAMLSNAAGPPVQEG